MTAKFLQRFKKQPEASITPSDDDEASLIWEEGMFFSPICPMNGSHSINSDESPEDQEEDDIILTRTATWKPTKERGYHKHAPLVAQKVLVHQQERGANPNPSCRDEEKRNLCIALKRAAQLPRANCFSNNCVMVNREREKRKVPPTNRSLELDNIAKWHVQAMAEASIGAFHADAMEIQARLESPCRRIGANVGVGESIIDIHMTMMRNRSMFNNICDRRYVEMGMATAKGKNGELYLCQIYRG